MDSLDGLLGEFDIIRRVTVQGFIIGDKIEAPCEICRLKKEQPEQLKKHGNDL